VTGTATAGTLPRGLVIRPERSLTAENFMAQNRNKHWIIKDDSRLRELLASRAPFRDIAVELGRDLAAVKGRAQRLRRELGVRPQLPSDTRRVDRQPKRPWTEQEICMLRELSTIDSIERIVEQLDRSVSSVKLKAYWLNLPLGRR